MVNYGRSWGCNTIIFYLVSRGTEDLSVLKEPDDLERGLLFGVISEGQVCEPMVLTPLTQTIAK